MVDPKFLKFDTRALHAGQRPDPVTGARAVPIYQTTSYVFRDTDHAAALFNLERAGYLYSRISNPTVAVLEERIAALEHGVGAVATASGQAALHLGIATLMGQGAHVVASASLYGGSINVFAHTMPRFGIETSFVKPRDLDGLRAAIRRHRSEQSTGPAGIVRTGRITIDRQARLVYRDGETISLTPTEFRLIDALAAVAGEVASHAYLLSTVWGPEYVDDSQYLRAYIGMLRTKLEDHPRAPHYLRNEWGVGYRLALLPPATPETDTTAVATAAVTS